MFKYLMTTKAGNLLILDRKAAARAIRLGYRVIMI